MRYSAILKTFTIAGLLCSLQQAKAQSWVWINGGDGIDNNATYGTVGVPDAQSVPGGTQGPSSWKDNSGAVWLYGGYGLASATGAGGSGTGELDDLWKYDQATNLWTWVSGDGTLNRQPTFGTMGTAAATNHPGGRRDAASWVDKNGNFWLFGGYYGWTGGIPAATNGRLNDLWKYVPSTGQWTWMSGDNTKNNFGNYGTKGTAATSNKPGSRQVATTWVDNQGNLWLFGGSGYLLNSGASELSDLWKYDVTTGMWTWMSGDNTIAQYGVYGTQGTAAANNKPGSRSGAKGVVDAAGNLWLFGGYGRSATTIGALNDLWKYNTTTNQWTWVSGADTAGQAGIYGTQGIANNTNVPGARFDLVSWADAMGDFWLYGGNGWTPLGPLLNDLWKYDPVANQWTWVSGDNTANQFGNYGTKGTASTTNKPGSRYYTIGWADAAGSFWLFGGSGYAKTGTPSGHYLNDLWNFQSCNVLTQPGSIVGDDTVCANSPNVYSVPALAGAISYTWTLPSGWTGSSTTNSIVTNSDISSGTIVVTASNSCGTSPSQQLTIHTVQIPTAHVNVNGNVLGTTSSYNTYQWYYNSQLMPGATGATINVTKNGLYSVKVSGEHGCVDSSIAYEVKNITGVTNVATAQAAIAIYPNPATDMVYIDAAQPVNVTICSMDGKVLLHTEHTNQADIHAFAAGVYVINVTDTQGQLLHISKLVKTVTGR